MSNIIASNICYGAGGSNNWTDRLTEVSLAYSNSVVYLKFSFEESISSCDDLKIKIKNEPSNLQAGVEVFNICISVFQNNEEYINMYSNSNVYPSHNGLVHREYTTYTKNTENEYTIPTDKMINTGPGIEYIMMIGTYDNEYGTSVELKVDNTSVEGIIATRTITYDMNTGNGDPIVVTVNKGDSITVSDMIPTKDGNVVTTTFEIKGMDNYVGSTASSSIISKKNEGTFYRFLGWSNHSNAIESNYSANDEIILFNNLILYAIWEEYIDTTYENNVLSNLGEASRKSINESYTITLDPNNGEEVTEYKVGKSTNYIFKGWGLTGTSTEIEDPNTEYFESVILYAIWETQFIDNSGIYLPIPHKESTNTNSYVVSVDANGGVIPENISEITSIRHTDFIFNCWSIDDTNDNAVELFFVPNQDTKLYAIYNSNTYIIPVELPIATKDGYIFAGWNEEKDSGVNVVNPYTPSKHITLYAHFVDKNKLKMHIYHNSKWHHIIM